MDEATAEMHRKEIAVLQAMIDERKKALGMMPRKKPKFSHGQVWKENDGTLYITSAYDDAHVLVIVGGGLPPGWTYAGGRGFAGKEELFEYVGMFDEVFQLRPEFDGGNHE